MDLQKEYIKIYSVPEGEKIVTAITYGGFYRWDFKFPFIHYVQKRHLVATEKSIYQLLIK